MKIRMGFIGVGGIGGAHLNVARNCADIIEPVAVCDTNAEIANRVAENHKLEAHTDYRELCQRGDIDAVTMALPHHLYGSIVSCYITLPNERRVTLHGIHGSLDVSSDNVTFTLNEEPQEVSIPEQIFDPMTLQMRHFVETIASGHDSPIAGVQRAYEVMRIVDAAYCSASRETKVKLTQ